MGLSPKTLFSRIESIDVFAKSHLLVVDLYCEYLLHFVNGDSPLVVQIVQISLTPVQIERLFLQKLFELATGCIHSTTEETIDITFSRDYQK